MSNIEQPEYVLKGVSMGERKVEFPQYGLESAPLMIEGKDGKKFDSGRRFVLRHDKIVADVTKRYTIFPLEDSLSIAKSAADKLGYKLHKVDYARNDNFMTATFLSDRLTVSPRVNDDIRLGFSIRNAIDGSSAFSSGLFSERLRCANGAISMHKLATMRPQRHLGDFDKFTKSFYENLNSFLEVNMPLLANFYKSLPSLIVNLKVAEALANVVPTKYLPSFIQRERKTRKVSLSGDGYSAYDAYNAITEQLTHSNADVRVQTQYVSNTHRVLEPLVAVVR